MSDDRVIFAGMKTDEWCTVTTGDIGPSMFLPANEPIEFSLNDIETAVLTEPSIEQWVLEFNPAEIQLMTRGPLVTA